MGKKKYSLIFSVIICLAVLWTLSLPTAAISQDTAQPSDVSTYAENVPGDQANPPPLCNLTLYGEVKSRPQKSDDDDQTNDQEKTEKFTKYSLTDKSLWYTDQGLIPQEVKNYNHYGTTVHYRNEVEITIQREGLLKNSYSVLLDGKNAHASASSDIVSSYPKPFVANTTYKIDTRDVDPDAPYSIFTVSSICEASIHNNYKQTRYEVNVYIYWDQSDLAPAPNVSFVYDAELGEMVLSGADSTMEYRLRSETTKDWKPCTDEPMPFDNTTTESLAYFVRYAAVGDGKPSQTVEIKLPPKRDTPRVTYDRESETFSALSTKMEIQIDDGPYVPVTASTWNISELIDSIPADSVKTIHVRYQATEKQPPSRYSTYKIYPRAQITTPPTFDRVTLSLSGYTTSMQYRGDTETDWKSMSGTSLSLERYASPDRTVMVYVRIKPTKEASASVPYEIKISPIAPGPGGRINYTDETITGLRNGSYQYSTTGTSWKEFTITNGQWDISGFIKSTSQKLHLRYAQTDTSPVSAATVFKEPLIKRQEKQGYRESRGKTSGIGPYFG